MKPTKILSAGAILLIIGLTSHAQQVSNSKPFLFYTMYLNRSNENRNINADSIMRIYKKYVLEPNQYYISSKIVSHWYGHDSRQVLVMMECKNWDDIPKAEARQNEIIQQLDKDKSMENAGKMFESLISPEHHSDEIYRVVAE